MEGSVGGRTGVCRLMSRIVLGNELSDPIVPKLDSAISHNISPYLARSRISRQRMNQLIDVFALFG